MDDFMPSKNQPFNPFPNKSDIDKARRDERVEVEKNSDLLTRLLAHYDARIEHFSLVDSVPHEFTVDSEKFMHTFAAHQIVRSILDEEREVIADLLKNVDS